MFSTVLKLRRYLLLVIMSSMSNQVIALSFTPSELEWLTWGDMCQARYIVSGAGMNSRFASRIPPEKVELWKNKTGGAWQALHHYCAAIIFDNKQNNPKRAISDYLYSFRRTPKLNPLYPVMGSKIALAHYKINDKQSARQYAQRIIDANPNFADGYLIKGIIERKEGELNRAIQTLEEGNKKTRGTSAELNYHLGIYYLSSGNYNRANKYAQVAYSLGYPLPWLREQLKKNGHWD